MKKQNGLPYKLRKRLLTSFFIIIVLMAAMNIGSMFWSGTYYKSLSDKLTQHVGIHRISMEFIAIPETLGNYISSGNSEYVTQVNQQLDTVQQQISFLKNNTTHRSMLFYQLYDVSNMVTSLSERIDQLVADYVNHRPMIYIYEQVNDIERHIGYIEGELSKVNSTYMTSIQEFYSGFSQTLAMVVQITVMVTLALVILSFFIARQFTLSVSRPIHTLALTMLQFGKGDLEAVIEPVKTKDEIAVLIDSFNSMGRRIKRLIQGIREKAEVERQLKSQELVNQETQRLLRESELALLQSQINPHFLFNTLNTIATIAQIEGAPQTEQLIGNLSTMLRYNLKNQNEMVKLEQEIVVVRSYMYIQQMRYGDKISFLEDLDPETFGELIPSMLLQPLIENAIKHGLEPLGRKGTVEMHIKRINDESIQIIIRDDGKGIEQSVIDWLEKRGPIETTAGGASSHYSPTASHSTEKESIDKTFTEISSRATKEVFVNENSRREKPLGMYNVLRRLELCYGDSTLSVRRRSPHGTECVITLPTRTTAILSGSSDDTLAGSFL